MNKKQEEQMIKAAHKYWADESGGYDKEDIMVDAFVEGYKQAFALYNVVSKRLSIKLEDWDHQCGDGCCDLYGTEIILNGKKCDNQYAGDDVRTALEFVLTELGFEVDIYVC